MPGIAKRIYERDIIDICKMWNKQLKTIEKVLPQYYSSEDIISLLKNFYPHEWYSVQVKYEYYTTKDKHLKRIKGKTRYNMEIPEKLIKQSQVFKKISSSVFKKTHSQSFNQDTVDREYQQLWKKRESKIEKINVKIEKAKLKTQQVTPNFLDKLIGLYERKNTTQKDKMYILLVLCKI